MYHYLFEEALSGEQFIVGEKTLTEARKIAENLAKELGFYYNDGKHKLKFYGKLTDEEAEMSGLDEF